MRILTILAAAAVLSTAALPAGAITKPAPKFALKQANGETVELAKLAGKVVVVNFWATWCGPCRAEIPGMLEVYRKLKGKGLEIVGVALDRQGFSVVTPFVERMKIDYPVVMGTQKTVGDYGNFQSIPTTFVIDRKGNIVGEHVGAMSKEQFEQLVAPYL